MNLRKLILLFCLLAPCTYAASKTEQDLKAQLAQTLKALQEKDRLINTTEGEKQALLSNVASLTRENTSLKSQAAALSAKAEALADETARNQSHIKLQENAVNAQASVIQALSTDVPNKVAAKRDKALAKLVSTRHAEDTAAFAKGASMAEVAADSANKAVALGEANRLSLLDAASEVQEHTRTMNEISHRMVLEDRLLVIIASVLVILMAIVTMLFLKRRNKCQDN